jgi:hypothetical protein
LKNLLKQKKKVIKRMSIKYEKKNGGLNWEKKTNLKIS